MIGLIRFLFIAAKAYAAAARPGHGVAYIATTENSVPNCAIFVGLNREAWRITTLAIESRALGPDVRWKQQQ